MDPFTMQFTESELLNLLVTKGLRITLILVAGILAWTGLRYLVALLTKNIQRLDKVEDSEFDFRTKTVMRFVSSVGLVVIVITTLLTILGELEVNIAPLIASVGVAGLALGLGAQTLVKDAIAGLFILLEDQFHVDDVIETAGVSGTVEDIRLRTTSIRDLGGTLHIVPNGEIRILSNSSSQWSRAKVEVYIPHHEDIQSVKDLLAEELQDVKKMEGISWSILEDFSISGPEDINAWGQKVRILVKTRPGKQWAVQREVRKFVLEKFRNNGISVAKPMPELRISDNG